MRYLLIFLLALSSPALGAEPELLEPDQAFRLMARLKDARTIEVNYQIAPGYYLYRDKFRFTLAPGDAKAGTPQLPAGKLKRDEFFGEVETYRGHLSIALPFELDAGSTSAITLTALSQGCADVGVCYVPHEQKARLNLAAAGGPAGDASLGQLLGSVSGRTARMTHSLPACSKAGAGWWWRASSALGCYCL